MKKKLLSFVLAFCITVCPLFFVNAADGSKLIPLEYPSEAITPFSPGMLEKISSDGSYEANGSNDGTGLFISPYFTLKTDGREVPVYASLSYNYSKDIGVLHSYSYIFVEDADSFEAEAVLSFFSKVKNAKILPESLNVKPEVEENRITAKISSLGIYTFLINDDSPEYSFTLFVKEYVDEEAEIEEYRREYGEENVRVLEKGFYEFEYVGDVTDNSVMYFRRGSYVVSKHVYDIESEEEFLSLPYREGFIEINNKKNVVVDGCGTVDFTQLDRKERDPLKLYYTEDCKVSGMIFINPAHWTVNSYASKNLEIKDITIFGYRTNSDGINICGCENVKVSDCFARNGDDCFSVKTMNSFYESRNIVFEKCIAWSTKARCFGITGEVEADISNIMFRDCAVIYRDATWDNDRVSSIAVVVENGAGNINDVVFENIEIYHDAGRAINCIVYGEDVTDCKVSGLVFRNVKFSAEEKSRLCTERTIDSLGKFSAWLYRLINKIFPNDSLISEKLTSALAQNFDSSNEMNITFENVRANGIKVDAVNKGIFFRIDGLCFTKNVR